MYPSWVSWCFDSEKRPVCSSLWDERYECVGPCCPFSHQIESSYLHCTCSLPLRLLDDSTDPNELFDYLVQTAAVETAEVHRTVVEPTQSEQDEEDVRRMLEEMQSFEEERREVCRYYLETGNCLRRDSCPYQHGKGDDESAEEVRNRWYPSNQDCTCCQGWVYKCQHPACALLGRCETCSSLDSA